MSAEHWYLAVLVVESLVEDGADAEPLVDLQYRLVLAPDHEEAHRRALELGGSAEDSYENSDGASVLWRFAGLHDLRKLDDQQIAHGAEVYSRLQHRAAHDYVVAKERLTEFLAEANGHKTAREILEGG